VFQGEPRQLLHFFRRDLSQGRCPRRSIQCNDTRAPIREPRHDGCDEACMARRHAGLDGCKSGTSRSALAGEQQLHFGIVQSDQSTA
jgi:hypothetical protein